MRVITSENSAQMYLLTDFLKPKPLRRARERARQPFDRLIRRLAAELKCPMMDGQDHLRARVVRHFQGLLRCAMGTDPGIIGANRHDGEIQPARRTQGPEGRRHRGVAAEYQTMV